MKGALETEGMGILCSDIQNDIHEVLEKVQARLEKMLADFGSHTDTFKDINKYNRKEALDLC